MSIRSLNDLRPGDIMISGQSTAPTKLLVYVGQLLLGEQFRIGSFAAGHVGIVISHKHIVEAMPSGARTRNLEEADWSPNHMYFRLPEDYPGQAFDAAAAAVAMIGTPYSFMSYVYLACYLAGFKFKWLANHIDRTRPTSIYFPTHGHLEHIAIPVEAICSVLVDQAWTIADKKVITGTIAQVVTPGMLAGQLWTREGVIRGGAGIN